MDCPGCGAHQLQNCDPGCDGEQVVPAPCRHRYVHLRSEKEKVEGTYNSTWKRRDVFFCEHCLDEQEKLRSESARNAPGWWTS